MERGRNQVETSTATPKIVLLFEERCLDNKRSFRNDQGVQFTRRGNTYLPRPHLPGATRNSRQTPVGCHRNPVGRLKRRLAIGGMAALLPARPGPKGPHKVTPEVIDLIRSHSDQLNVPTLVRLVKERTGVSLHVRRLVHHHRPATVEL